MRRYCIHKTRTGSQKKEKSGNKKKFREIKNVFVIQKIRKRTGKQSQGNFPGQKDEKYERQLRVVWCQSRMSKIYLIDVQKLIRFSLSSA